MRAHEFSLKISYQNLFKIFLLFAILYNGYRYFFVWDRGGQAPSIPLYVSVLKDVPWAIVVFVGLYILYWNKKLQAKYMYRAWDKFNYITTFFVITHLVLLFVAISHLFHKNPIDILQRDIKNVQYIFLPFIFPLIIQKEQDVIKHINWLMIIGVFVCLFGYIIYLFMPSFTWENAVLSTFQSPICFGTFVVMLFLILLSRIVIEKKLSISWYIGLGIFYGSILSTASFAALLSMIVGMLFLLIISRPNLNILARLCALFIVSSLLFYSIGLFNKYIDKGEKSFATYKALEGHKLYEEKPKPATSKHTSYSDPSLYSKPTLLWEILKNPYEPAPDNTYYFPFQYTSIAGRKAYLMEMITYLKTASTKDILWGSFSLRNHFEYDNVYFYFIKNDGIIVALLLFVLLSSGIFIGLKKFTLFRKAGNNKMASVSLGITAVLLVSVVIQFNLSYFLTIYPHNLLTYFLLILISFINPSMRDSSKAQNPALS